MKKNLNAETINMISVTKIFRFESAHAITSYEGACHNIHGHSYELHIAVTGKDLDKSGMLIDFKSLKNIVQMAIISELDHSLILMENPMNRSATKNMLSKVFWLPEEPTVENMISFIAQTLKPLLPKDIKLVRIRLYETNSCYAEWE